MNDTPRDSNERIVTTSDAHTDLATTIGVGRSGGSDIAAEGEGAAAAIAVVLERAGGRTGGNIGREAAVAAVRAERDAR